MDPSKTQSPTSFLLTLVARNHLGEVAACVVSHLISHGRLSAQDLTTHTKLPPKAVRQALVSLVQLNCVSYWKDRHYFYSLNPEGLLCLFHAGEIIAHITASYGAQAAEIIQNVLLHGHVQLDQYMGECSAQERLEQETLFFRLFQGRWLIRLMPAHYHPKDDVWEQLFAETAKQTPRTLTTSEVKRLAEVRDRTKLKYSERAARGTTFEDLYHTEGGIKKLRGDIVVRVNLARFNAAAHTNALVSLSQVRIGTLTAAVYETALRMVEKNAPVAKHDFLAISGLINDPDEARQFANAAENRLVEEKKTVFTVKDLVKLLPADVDLRGSIIKRDALKAKREDSLKRENDDDNNDNVKRLKTEDGFASVVEDNDCHAVELVEHHLKLLAQGTAIQFLVEMTPGTYTVPYSALTKVVRQHHFEMMVKTTLGLHAFRVLRCLKQLRLGDEKSIANAVLLKEKTVRNELYKLVRLNCVEIQEVPRSADRAASKTFFLFRHREHASYAHFAKSMMYSMGVIMENVAAFKDDHRILLDKCEREDVKGHEDELLLESELKTLKALQTREINNVARLHRLKSLCDIFGEGN